MMYTVYTAKDYSFPPLPICSSPLSSMVFGTNALFTKPAQSLAPMLVVTILNQFNYEDLKVITKTSNPE